MTWRGLEGWPMYHADLIYRKAWFILDFAGKLNANDYTIFGGLLALVLSAYCETRLCEVAAKVSVIGDINGIRST